MYLLVEERLQADRVPDLAAGTDGILEIVAHGDSWVEIAIWNPDGSHAEMSGNGTRIAAKWLAERTGARDVRVRVGQREVTTHLRDGEIEQELGAVRVSEPERIAGLDVIVIDVGNPHAVVIGDPDDVALIGPLLETHPRFPNRTNVQVARVDGPGLVTARVWERGVGETRSSGTSAVAVAAATRTARVSPSYAVWIGWVRPASSCACAYSSSVSRGIGGVCGTRSARSGGPVSRRKGSASFAPLDGVVSRHSTSTRSLVSHFRPPTFARSASS